MARRRAWMAAWGGYLALFWALRHDGRPCSAWEGPSRTARPRRVHGISAHEGELQVGVRHVGVGVGETNGEGAWGKGSGAWTGEGAWMGNLRGTGTGSGNVLRGVEIVGGG